MNSQVRILLVEDNDDDALLLLRQLKKGGLDLLHHVVETREAMLEALLSEQWDIVISDYNMPSFDGLSALKLLHETEQDIPFIVVSGAIGDESAAELLRAGAGDFIRKGSWHRLVPAILRELRDARHRRERAKERKARAKAEARYTELFENAVEGIFMTSPEGEVLSANPALARGLGYDSPSELLEQRGNLNDQFYVNPDRRDELLRQLAEKGVVTGFEAQVYCKDKSIIWIAIHARAALDSSGSIKHLEGMVENITSRKQAEEMLYQNAFYDKLTGLPNRALLTDRLDRSLERAKRHPEMKYALLFLDLDQFKNINDSLGHQAGDELLLAVGNKLRKCVRAMDTVARFGGDEFALLLEELTDYKMALRVARRIQSELTSPTIIQNQEVYTSSSIGIVLSTQVFESAEAVLRAADIAMYQAKKQGRNRFKVFNQRMDKKARKRLELETNLRQAINHEQFRVYYQPIIDVASQRITGLEALVRWERPGVGLVGPADFIPACEETGLISTLGHWVLVTACAQTKVWQQKIPGMEDLCISVNISGYQIEQPDLTDHVRWAVEDAGLAPQTLTLEITETALMSDVQKAANVLEKLRALGVSLSVDDFGTGYSSLAYLNSFPVNVLKIDRSFVARMTDGEKDEQIVRTILSLAQNMSMKAVAEGVETLEQLRLIEKMGCDYAQGYYFSRPQPPSKIEQLLQTGISQTHAGSDHTK